MSLSRRNFLVDIGVPVMVAPMFLAKAALASNPVPDSASAVIPPRPLPVMATPVDLLPVHPDPDEQEQLLPSVTTKPLSAPEPSHDLRAMHTLTGSGTRHDLAFTIWAEARGFGENGMRAIGHVIVNRAKADTAFFGKGISGVCRKHKQFSCWNSSGDPNRTRLHELVHVDHDNADWKAWVIADRVAARLIAGADKDNTSGSTFFHASTIKPYWTKRMRLVGVMFGHTFYKPISKV